MRTKTLIVSIILLVFLMTISYLYFEFTTESQNIYVADQSNRSDKPVIARKNTVVKKAPVIAANKNIAPITKNGRAASVEKIKTKKISSKAISPPAKKKTIKIVHKIVKDPLEDLVRRAYIAFNQGEYTASEKLYMQAIAEEPKNRDALLGLAAIAVKQQRYEYARQKYLQLRHLNPKDSIAIAGLSAMQSKINSALSVSELKFMLREQPEAAHLYFALGSIYAGQQKWADAQAEFFSAWSAENTNADYAFNLAVSLDQLGKKNQAKQLYKLSLKLNQVNKGNFSNKIVAKRISILNKHGE